MKGFETGRRHDRHADQAHCKKECPAMKGFETNTYKD